MGEVNNLEGFVNRGWHALSGYVGKGMQSLASREPNSQPLYDGVLGGIGAGMLINRTGITYKIIQSRLGEYHAKNIPNGNLHDGISEQRIIGSDMGMTKPFEVYMESLSSKIETEIVEPATKGFFGYGAKPPVTREKPREKIYSAVYADAQGNISTNSEGNEKLLGMIFEFADSRWPRGFSTAQYSVVLRESDYRQLYELIKKDPSLMLQLLFAAFPEYKKLEGRGPFKPASKFIFAETLDDLRRLRE